MIHAAVICRMQPTHKTTSWFQIWAIGIPAPRCLVLRGQRFGGTFSDRWVAALV